MITISTVKKLIVTAFMIGTVASCSTHSTTEYRNLPLPTAEELDLSQYADQPEFCRPVNEAMVTACAKGEGKMIKQGMAGCYSCLINYADAGKACSDGKDCQNDCYATEFTDYGKANQTGQCASNNSPFGCRQKIVNGVAQPALCVD